MRALAAIALLLAGCAALAAPDPEPLTVFVVIDDASVATLGAFPVDRAVYARAIRAARDQGASAVALKFFFDAPSASASDRALADAERELPVLLQVQAAPANEQRLPGNLLRDDWDLVATPQPFRMDGVELPIPQLAGAARGLGFVDARTEGFGDKVEVAGVVDHRAVASLAVTVVEFGIGRHAVVADNRLQLGISSFALDQEGRVGCDWSGGPPPRAYGIDALLSGGIPRGAIEGKVVVLGYLRQGGPTLDVGGKKMPIHEAFYRQVACLARKAGAR